MYSRLRDSVLRGLRVPPEPQPPAGAPASLRVFRAGKNYLKLRLWTWAAAQLAALAGIEVVLGWRFPPGLASRLPALRWVCAMAAGVDKLLVPELAPSVLMSRTVDPDQALGIAQYVALMVLRQARALPVYEQQQRARQWTRHPMAAARSRVLVLGYGEVGRECGRLLSALGFAVSGWRRSSARGRCWWWWWWWWC